MIGAAHSLAQDKERLFGKNLSAAGKMRPNHTTGVNGRKMDARIADNGRVAVVRVGR
jgi:hypothetical protein